MARGWGRLDAGILGGACVLLLVHAWYFGHTCDDAFISFRYARNWVDGHGLVFNPGEYVMGYSNLLWVLLLGVLYALGVDPEAGARLLGAVFTCATFARLYGCLRERYETRLPAVAAIGLLGASGTVALWTFGGLEGPLFAFLLVVAVTGAMRVRDDADTRDFVRIGVALGLAALTRPEGAAYAVPVALWLWLRRRDRRRTAQVAALLATAFSFAAVGLVFAWLYYGDPLPNTYYAKAHSLSLEIVARGLAFVRAFLDASLWTPVLIVGGWAALVRLRPSAPGWLPLLMIGAFVVFYLKIGGDALVYYRMWLWVLPMFALLAAEAVARLPRRAGAVAAGVVVAATFANSVRGPDLRYLREDDAFLADVTALSASLAKLPPDTLVAANNVGVIAWSNDLAFVDMLGLLDRHIARAPGKRVGIPAHESHDGAYVLDRAPDLIFAGIPRVVDEPLTREQYGAVGYPSDRDLGADPRLRGEYEFAHLRLEDGRFAPVFRRSAVPSPGVRPASGSPR